MTILFAQEKNQSNENYTLYLQKIPVRIFVVKLNLQKRVNAIIVSYIFSYTS